MKKILLLLASLLLIVSCSDDNDNGTTTPTEDPTAKIVSVADLHYFDPDYIDVTNPDYQQYLAMDRKLITESQALLEEFKNQMTAKSDVEYVFIPGDLTKDGEKTSHEKAAAYLAEIEATGKKVFVVPGNHDVENGMAVSFAGTTTPVPSVTPEEFKTIYADFGYNEADYQDPNSLTYIVKLKDKLWLFAMDACRYDENQPGHHSTTGGKFKDETLTWINQKLDEAKAEGAIVIGMMHHGVVAHYAYQPQMFAEYLVEDFAAVSTNFADRGMKAVFTGHYHANDNALWVSPNNSENEIYDIETGSLVTYPCPYRTVELTENKELVISTSVIEQINFDIGSFATFQEYALDYLESGLTLIGPTMLQQQFGATPEQAEILTPYIVRAFIAHYKGDETPSAEDEAFYNALLQSQDPTEQMMGGALQSIWNDPAPADNNLTITLK